jgi:Tol biopolymer transport system component
MPDGRPIISVEQQGSVRLLISDRDGRWPCELAGSAEGDCWDAQPSPDGSLVAYTFRPFDDLNRLDIHVVDAQTGQIRTLAGTPKLRNWHGRWSPGGDQIAFLSQH